MPGFSAERHGTGAAAKGCLATPPWARHRGRTTEGRHAPAGSAICGNAGFEAGAGVAGKAKRATDRIAWQGAMRDGVEPAAAIAPG